MNAALRSLRREKKLFLKMEQFIMVNGVEIISKGTEFKSGQMEPDMKACGRTVKLVARESSGM
jgi:hypothetical protein